MDLDGSSPGKDLSSDPPTDLRQDMKRVIRFGSKWDAEGFLVLINAGSGVALPGNSYIVTDRQIAALRAKGIPFDEVALSDAAAEHEQGAVLERV